ncbi:terpene synthase family protein [Kitasatospora sp. NBC_00085]|uniref:terpene synthase family protein n=1 Tax=unclassified Kitasatospora TaxID=2633591 RepID=UPI0032564BC5
MTTRTPALPGVFTGLPAGLGHSAQRAIAALARPHAATGLQPCPPAFVMPYPVRMNPHLEAARERAAEWAERTGLTGPDGVWGREHFDLLELALFTALTQPDLSREELLLVGDWNVWAFAVDDHFLRYKAAADEPGAQRFVTRLAACMPLGSAAAPAPQHPVEAALADVWTRSAPALPAGLRRRLRDAALDFAAANLWELANNLRGRIPDPVEYLQMRRRTAGTPLSTVLPLHASGQDLPPQLLGHPIVSALIDAFADNVDLRNDLYSHRKETELEGELNNAVPVFQRFLHCPLQTAVDTVGDLMNARLDCFDRLIREELPKLADEFGPEGYRVVAAFADGLKDWLAGDHAWYPRTGRYTAGLG